MNYVQNHSFPKILTKHKNYEYGLKLGLFMRGSRLLRTNISTPIRMSPIRFKVFQPKKNKRIISQPFLFLFTTRISGDDFSSTLNLFIAYRFCRCTIHLSSKSAKLSHKYCNNTRPNA